MAVVCEVVRLEPLPIAERIETQRRVTTHALRRFREALEADAGAESWEVMEFPAAMILSDVCTALGLSDDQRYEVLGLAGRGCVEVLTEERAAVV